MGKMVSRIALWIIFFFYFLANLMNSDFWGYILSPIIVLFITFIIFNNFCLKAHIKSLKVLGLLLTASTFVWAVGDILLAIDYFFKLNSIILFYINDYIYGFSTIFIFIEVSIFIIHKLRKIDISQAILNISLVTIGVLTLIWVIFFDSSIENVIKLNISWYDCMLLIMDFIIFMEISLYFITIRQKKIPISFIIFPAGIILFVVSEMIYYYQFFFSEYVVNSVLDSIYVLAFALIAISLDFRIKNYEDELLIESKNSLHNGWWAILFPFLIIFFDGLNYNALFIVSATVAVFFLIASFIQKNTYHKEIIGLQEQLTKELEEKVKERTNELNVILNTHNITGLFNARYFIDYMNDKIKTLVKGEKIVLLYIELDRFRTIKMIYGDAISSKLLKKVSDRLKVIGRFYPDSVLVSYEEGVFLISLHGDYDYRNGMIIAKKVISRCSDIYQIEEYNIKVSINIGVSVCPSDSRNTNDLIKNANLAMAHSRGQGDNEALTFEKELGEFIYYRTKIAMDLKKINYDEQFFLNFQPQVSSDNGQVIAFEALLRWKTKEGKMIPPGDFIPIAEESGSIMAIGDWVITQALKQMDDWRKQGKESLRMAINVSAKQLGGRYFLDKLVFDMARFGILPELIELEITESIQLEKSPETVEILYKIRELGISIAIDDFGTGYSSLYYFKNLPVDRIKISKPLIDKIDKDPFEYFVVKAVIDLGKVKGVKVIAEGVETKEQWECLKELGCDEMQGYYFGKPVMAEDAYEGR